MSDTPTPAAPVEAAPPPAEVVPPPEPTITPEYVAELRREAASSRPRAQAFEQRFGGLDNEAMESLSDFVELLRTGDAESASRWAIESAKNLAGPQWTQLVARYGVQGATQAVQEAAATEGVKMPGAAPAAPAGEAPMTRAEVAAMLAEQQKQTAITAAQQQIDRELHDLSIMPGSPTAVAVSQKALSMFRERGVPVSMAEALQAYRADIAPLLGVTLPPAVDGQGAVAPAGGGVPNTSTPRPPGQEKQAILERLAAAAAGGVR